MYKLLVVEDSESSYDLISQAAPPNSKLSWAKNISEAKNMMLHQDFDLMIVDLMLPDGLGYEISTLAQSHPKFAYSPVMFISSKKEIGDKVMGFASGADDYIEKPFNLLELQARLQAKLRRIEALKHRSEKLIVGPIHVDVKAQEVSIKSDGQRELIDLTPIEYKILVMLASQPGKVFSRDTILDQVWGKDVHVFPRSVDTHVSKLRRKLKQWSNFIKSVHSAGYKITTDLSDESEEPRLVKTPEL